MRDVWRGMIVAASQAEPAISYAPWQRSVEAVTDTIDAEVQEQKKTNPFVGPEDTHPILSSDDRLL